jgi:hypothetical protein
VKLLKGKRLTPVMRVENQSFAVGSCGRSDRKAGVCFIFVVSDALFHLQVNISLLCWTKLQGKVAA